jgi:predicted nuclease with TOPRIM domain
MTDEEGRKMMTRKEWLQDRVPELSMKSVVQILDRAAEERFEETKPVPGRENDQLRAEVERLELTCQEGQERLEEVRAELAKMSEVYEAGLRLGITWRDGRDELQAKYDGLLEEICEHAEEFNGSVGESVELAESRAKYDKLLLLASRVRTARYRNLEQSGWEIALDDLCIHVAESDPKEEPEQ